MTDKPKLQRRKPRSDKGKKTRVKARSAVTEQKRSRAVEFALQGYSYEEIGKAIGLSKTRAFQLVQESLDAAAAERKGNADALREMQMRQVQQMMFPFLRAAMGGQNGEVRDAPAVETVLALMDRQAKLAGVYAPTRTETAVFGKEGAPPIAIKREMDAAARKFFDKVARAIAAADQEIASRGDHDGGSGDASLSVGVLAEGGTDSSAG